jgi:hypothetical protein
VPDFNYPHCERPGRFTNWELLNIWLRRLFDAFDNVRRGKINVVTDVTLTANAASTTLAHPLIGPESFLEFQPLTANAKAEYVGASFRVSSQTAESCVIAHANNAQTDREFRVLIIGG